MAATRHDEAEAEASAIDASGLFDRAYYLARHPDVGAAGIDPVLHFRRFGWREDRDPSPWFATATYRRAYPDVRGADLNPLLHYARHGEAEGRRPSDWFDPVWFAAAFGVPLIGALAHFMRHRAAGRLFPLPSLYALVCGPESGGERLLRHVTGAGAGAAAPDEAVIAASGVFDADFYLLNGTDVHTRDLDPVAHFCGWGWREGRRPCLYFDTAWYLRTNPAVVRLGINPLTHYLLEGEAAGRRPVPYFDPAWYRARFAVAPERSALADFLARRRTAAVSPTPLFDAAWYAARHGIPPGRDVFAHFLRAGSFADCDPSPDFSAAAYRRARMGRRSRHFGPLTRPERDNPLVHFLAAEYDAQPGRRG
jgi:hypothetical protein